MNMNGGSLEEQINAVAVAQLHFSSKINVMREEEMDGLDAENQVLLAKAKAIQRLVEDSIRKGTSAMNRGLRLNSIIQKHNEYSKLISDAKRRAHTRRTEEQERNQLMAGYPKKEGASIAIEILAKEGETLDHTNRKLFETEGAAHAALRNLQLQNDSLKNLQRKILDLASTIGISHSVVRHIQRRLLMDRLLLWGGIVVTLLVLFICWYFFR